MSPDPLFLPAASPADSSTAADGRVALDAALLKTLRKARGLSQEALAELCQLRQLPVSIASIKRAETGKAVLYRTARHLASIFGTEPESLLARRAAITLADAPAAALLRYLIELHITLAGPVARATLDAIGQTVARHGGQLIATPELVGRFGAARTTGSDAERCLRCAIELAASLRGHGIAAMAIRHVHAGPMARQPPPPPPRDDSGSVPVYVARDLAAQLASRFDFDTAAGDSGYLRFAAAAPVTRALALAGRVTELRQFEAVAGAVAEAHASHIVYLRAPAGTGKSRLAAALSDFARLHHFSTYRCEVPDAGAPDWHTPLEQLARQLFAPVDNSDAALDAAIDAALQDAGSAPQSALFCRALAGARMPSDQMSVHAAMSHAMREQGRADALLALVAGKAARAPLLLTVEDIHWGAPALFAALGQLMAGTRELPVIWVLSSRIEHDPLETSLRPHLFDQALTVFDLAPLGARDALALAGQFESVAPAHRQRCVERAQGNPLFLTLLLASPDQHLPLSLKLAVQARLDNLAPDQRNAMCAAAVIGKRFELDMLRAVLEQPGYAPDDAGRSALVRPNGPGCYGFVHDLVMHCIYEAIEPSRQRSLHRAVAAQYRERDPALAAQHMYRAGDPAAFDMMLIAIRDRLAQHQYDAALELTAACSAHDSTRFSSFTLALLKAHATAGLGQTAQARLAYEHALKLAGRPQEKIEAVLGLAATLNVLDLLNDEEALIDDTLPLARAIDADAGIARLLYLKGNIYFPRGDYSECRRHHAQAVRHAQAAGATETEARALSGMGDSWYAQGRMRTAHDAFARCIAMCEEQRYVGIEAPNRAALGSTRIYLGDAEGALADALRAADLAQQVGNRRAEVFARMTAGWVLVAAGSNALADAQCAQALALARGIGAARFEPLLLESLARSAWHQGDRSLALRYIGEAAAMVGRLHLQRFCGPWVMGTLALLSDDAALRKRSLLQGAAWLTGDCLAHNAYRFFVSAAESALLDGDMVAAGFYTDQLALLGEAEPSAWVDYHVALLRGEAPDNSGGFSCTTPRRVGTGAHQ